MKATKVRMELLKQIVETVKGDDAKSLGATVDAAIQGDDEDVLVAIAELSDMLSELEAVYAVRKRLLELASGRGKESKEHAGALNALARVLQKQVRLLHPFLLHNAAPLWRVLTFLGQVR